MKSQSSSQSEPKTAGEILDWYFWSVDKATEENRTSMREAQAKLLSLALSCLPERKDKLVGSDAQVYTSQEYLDQAVESFNAAIDTIEQNIKSKFGGSNG